jgi:CBS domain-containing protein
MLQAQEIMTQNVVTIRGSATVADAVKLMKEKKLRGLIVEPRHEQDPYGIVTETDIVYKVAAFGHDPKTMRVYEIMAKPCVVVNPELGVEYVARLFRAKLCWALFLSVIFSSRAILSKSPSGCSLKMKLKRPGKTRGQFVRPRVKSLPIAPQPGMWWRNSKPKPPINGSKNRGLTHFSPTAKPIPMP